MNSNLATQTRDLGSLSTTAVTIFSNAKLQEFLTNKIFAFDLGKFKSVCCLLDTKTRKFEFFTVATERNYPTTAVMLHPFGLGHKPLVCSINEEAWKWANGKRRTDRSRS
jgi:hypothetical protein